MLNYFKAKAKDSVFVHTTAKTVPKLNTQSTSLMNSENIEKSWSSSSSGDLVRLVCQLRWAGWCCIQQCTAHSSHSRARLGQVCVRLRSRVLRLPGESLAFVLFRQYANHGSSRFAVSIFVWPGPTSDATKQQAEPIPAKTIFC